MQLLTITNINHGVVPQNKGASSFRNNNVLDKMKGRQMRQKMQLLSLEGHFFFSMRKSGGRLRALI